MHVTYHLTAHEIKLQQQLRSLAHHMRLNPTAAEAGLWAMLRKRELHGLKFRRQHPLFSYIVDFYCHSYRLIIEVDGEIHQHQIPRDQSRDEFFRSWGYTILRIKNEEVFSNTKSVLQKIDLLLSQVGEEVGRKGVG